MNVYQKLNEVRRKVAYIQKDKKVEGSGYMAVTHDAVTSAVREHLVEQGVLIYPTLITAEVKDTTMTTGKGIPIIRYEGTYEIAFVNCDDPQDRIALRLQSHALDQGDKAPGKAISYATKYAMLKLFSIETGEEEEERILVRAKITPTAGAMERLNPQQQDDVNDLAGVAVDFLNADNVYGAHKVIEDAKLGADEKVALWTFFDSKQRSALKKFAAAQKGAN